MSLSHFSQTVIMVPPTGFKFNTQTAQSNAFQQPINDRGVLGLAMSEFNCMVDALKKNTIKVLLLEQPSQLPDAVFPNNWFSTHINNNQQTELNVFPMLCENRQQEVNLEGLMALFKRHHIHISNVRDLRVNSADALEGTGSMVIDHQERIIYACRSVRTSEHLLHHVAKTIDYKLCLFTARDTHGQCFYHTNVMLSLGHDFSLVYLKGIHSEHEKKQLLSHLRHTKALTIELSIEQVHQMCANALQLKNSNGDPLLVLSEGAIKALTKAQVRELERYTSLLPVSIATIERIGGGSARCMMAEVFV